MDAAPCTRRALFGRVSPCTGPPSAVAPSGVYPQSATSQRLHRRHQSNYLQPKKALPPPDTTGRHTAPENLHTDAPVYATLTRNHNIENARLCLWRRFGPKITSSFYLKVPGPSPHRRPRAHTPYTRKQYGASRASSLAHLLGNVCEHRDRSLTLPTKSPNAHHQSRLPSSFL